MGFRISWDDDLLQFIADQVIEGKNLEEAAGLLCEEYPQRLYGLSVEAVYRRLRGRILQGAHGWKYFLEDHSTCNDSKKIQAAIDRLIPEKEVKEAPASVFKVPTNPLDIYNRKKLGRL